MSTESAFTARHAAAEVAQNSYYISRHAAQATEPEVVMSTDGDSEVSTAQEVADTEESSGEAREETIGAIARIKAEAQTDIGPRVASVGSSLAEMATDTSAAALARAIREGQPGATSAAMRLEGMLGQGRLTEDDMWATRRYTGEIAGFVGIYGQQLAAAKRGQETARYTVRDANSTVADVVDYALPAVGNRFRGLAQDHETEPTTVGLLEESTQAVGTAVQNLTNSLQDIAVLHARLTNDTAIDRAPASDNLQNNIHELTRVIDLLARGEGSTYGAREMLGTIMQRLSSVGAAAEAIDLDDSALRASLLRTSQDLNQVLSTSPLFNS